MARVDFEVNRKGASLSNNAQIEWTLNPHIRIMDSGVSVESIFSLEVGRTIANVWTFAGMSSSLMFSELRASPKTLMANVTFVLLLIRVMAISMISQLVCTRKSFATTFFVAFVLRWISVRICLAGSFVSSHICC